MARYKDPYENLQVDAFNPAPESAGEKNRSNDSDMWRFIGDIAPGAGAALGTGAGAAIGGILGAGAGALPGATIGGGIGAGLGSMVGAGAHAHAEDVVGDDEIKRGDANSRRQMLLSLLASKR